MNKKNENINQPSVCIIIPAYKDFADLNTYEVISLSQCVKVLHNYPIFFAGPESMDWSGYDQLCSSNNVLFRTKNFSNHFFEGIEGYNSLMMNVDFYDTFSEFKFMLVCQTDCFVFKDELSEWCKRGYDYIGAPWINLNMFQWFLYPVYPRKLVHVHRFFKNRFIHKTGNGGFSLRKISSIVTNLRRFHKAAEKWQTNEDSFFCHYVGTFNPFFHIPSVKTALKFSFDAYPEEAYKLNHNNLPFACHAWFRDDETYYESNLPFWKPVIKNFISQDMASKL